MPEQVPVEGFEPSRHKTTYDFSHMSTSTHQHIAGLSRLSLTA
jgi:hypothetical protein